MILKTIFHIYVVIAIAWVLFFIVFGAINLPKLKQFVGLKPKDNVQYCDAIMMGIMSCILWPLFSLFLFKKSKQKNII